MKKKDELDISKLTVWVGAGISIKDPARLPSGNELTEFALTNMIIGKDKFLEIWRQINSYENKYCNLNVTKFPRLELLLSSIAYIEKYFMGKGRFKGKFLGGLKAFDEVPYNDNHMLLAALVHAGACVMTANFDLGIERAYKSLYGEECNKVVHFHGTNSSGDKIGATIENITHFVNRTIDHKVKKSFQSMNSNYFYGYSFSDMYDINTAIYELYSSTNINYTKDNWVCNHNGKDDELAEKAYNSFAKEENVNIIEKCDTTVALKCLCAKYSVDIPSEVEKYNAMLRDNVCWKEMFLAKTEITEEFKILSTIHFFNRMGIAVDKVDKEILDKYEQLTFDNDKKEILEYHLAANSKYWFERYGNTRLKTDYHKRELHKRQMSAELKNILTGNYVKNDVHYIIQNIKKKKFIMYEDFNELNMRMNEFKIQLIKGVNENELKNSDILEIKYLIDEFSKFPVGKYISIQLYASIYRYKMLIANEDEEENRKNLQKASELYYDIGNIDGIVSSRLYHFISSNDKKSIGKWKRIFQTQEWKELKNLCRDAGSYRYEQLMNKLEMEKVGV